MFVTLDKNVPIALFWLLSIPGPVLKAPTSPLTVVNYDTVLFSERDRSFSYDTNAGCPLDPDQVAEAKINILGIPDPVAPWP